MHESVINEKPWFIHDQQISYWDSNGGPNSNGVWKNVRDREALALGNPFDSQQNHVRFVAQRTLILSDAGYGKSTFLNWITYRLSQNDNPYFPYLQGVRSLSAKLTLQDLEESFFSAIADEWYRRIARKHQSRIFDKKQASSYIRAFARQGMLCIMLDSLDHASVLDVEKISQLLSSPELRRCRWFISGREHSINRHQLRLSIDESWLRIRPEPFNLEQQVRYLGWLPNGSNRFNRIPKQARGLLKHPRLLSLVRKWNDFESISQPAAVLYRSVVEYINNHPPSTIVDRQSEKVLESQDRTDTTLALLSILAFQSLIFHRIDDLQDGLSSVLDAEFDMHTSEYVCDILNEPDSFDVGVSRAEFRVFRGVLKEECHKRGIAEDFDAMWSHLFELDLFLESASTKDGTELRQIVWANRTLHEFLLAYYFSALAMPEEISQLESRLWIKDQTDSEAYYYFWQYLSEMPSDARVAEVWLTSIEVLYRTSIPKDLEHLARNPTAVDAPKNEITQVQIERRCHTIKSVPQVVVTPKPFRSSEMIFRSWKTLKRYQNHPRVGARARKIMEAWQSEFQTMYLGGRCGPSEAVIAKEIVDQFVSLPGGTFWMGTSKKNLHARNHSFKEVAKAIYSQLTETQTDFRVNAASESLVGADRHELQFLISRWKRTAMKTSAKKTIDTIANDLCPIRETKSKRSISSFWLARTTVLVKHYRLFDPGHQKRRSFIWESQYGAVSDEDCATHLNWFDAWVFCKWLNWDGRSCQIPTEEQWEYAAKFGFGSDHRRFHHRYWWGPTFDGTKDRSKVNCLATNSSGNAVRPDSRRASDDSKEIDSTGHGLADMLGNLHEWCFDSPNGHKNQDIGLDPCVPRAGRGGCFKSNIEYEISCWNRRYFQPSKAGSTISFRVCRVTDESYG